MKNFFLTRNQIELNHEKLYFFLKYNFFLIVNIYLNYIYYHIFLSWSVIFFLNLFFFTIIFSENVRIEFLPKFNQIKLNRSQY